MKIFKLVGAILVGIFEQIVLPIFKRCRAISRTDTPADERAIMNTLMAWSVVILVMLIIIGLMGWGYVFTID